MFLKRALSYLFDLFWLRVLGGIGVKRSYQERARTVIERIISLYPADEPYVIDGKWNWFYLSPGFHPPISLVLLERGIAVMVFGPEVGPWRECKLYCRKESDWEIANAISSKFLAVCENLEEVTGIPIYWDDPIDIESLKLKLPARED